MHKAIVVGARQARLDADLTVLALAMKAQASDRTIQWIEREQPVKLSTAKKVAKALKLPADAVVVIQ